MKSWRLLTLATKGLKVDVGNARLACCVTKALEAWVYLIRFGSFAKKNWSFMFEPKQSTTERVIRDLQLRTELGISRYGESLQAGNHQGSARDQYDELLDAVQYSKKHLDEIEGMLTRLTTMRKLIEADDYSQDELIEVIQSIESRLSAWLTPAIKGVAK